MSSRLSDPFGRPVGRRNRDHVPTVGFRCVSKDDQEDRRQPSDSFSEQPTETEPEDADCPLGLWEMKIAQSAYRDINDYFADREPEAAGILIGPIGDDPLVTHFVPDSQGVGSASSFRLGAAHLNSVLRRFKHAGSNCKGVAHSHPPGVPQPSFGDQEYLRGLFRRPKNADALQCFMPIFCDGRLYPYVYARDQIWHAELILV